LKYIFVFLSIFFVACSSKNINNVEKVEVKKHDKPKEDIKKTIEVTDDGKILDLINIPQDVDNFLVNVTDESTLFPIQTKYEKYYFSMWNKTKPREDLASVKWPFNTYTFGKSYGENLQLLEKEFFDKMLNRANFKDYATLNLKAITLSEVNIRAFPTCRPVLMDPNQAGEGFPFDYMQNSTLHANKPILLSHYSKDKEWAYIFTSFTSGWIKSSELVLIDKKYTNKWQKAKQVRIIKENIPIYDENNNFMFRSKIGMMFALVNEDKDTYTILTVAKYKNKRAFFVKSKIPKNIASKDILKLTKQNLKTIINEVKRTNYGWGGMYGQRDCSSMLRDLYSPFGIWLPRNSYQQAKVGKIISFEDKTNKEKIAIIKEKAIPFKTLLYKKGHIVLYVGTYEDEIVIFHNTWGIKTKKNGTEGRFVIGRPVFSTLSFGKGLRYYDESSEILTNLKSMNILTN